MCVQFTRTIAHGACNPHYMEHGACLQSTLWNMVHAIHTIYDTRCVRSTNIIQFSIKYGSVERFAGSMWRDGPDNEAGGKGFGPSLGLITGKQIVGFFHDWFPVAAFQEPSGSGALTGLEYLETKDRKIKLFIIRDEIYTRLKSGKV